MADKNRSPELKITEKDLDPLFARLEGNTLTSEDKQLLKNICHFLIWLQEKYEAGRLTIHNLKRLLFGKRSEKRSKSKDKGQKNKESKGTDSTENPQVPEEEKTPPPSNVISFPSRDEDDPPKGHGRLGADDYPDAEEIFIPHPDLKAKDPCPENCGGRLYEITPNELIRIIGQSMAKVIRYQLQRLRCARCGLVVKAEMPPGMSQEKYDARFKAILAVQKYFGGVPFYRQQHLQALQNFPLPDATQWELVEQVANCVYPSVRELERLAAQGEVVHNDDTSVKIVEVIQANKNDPERERTGMFTSGIIAKVGEREIALYYSGTQHAGENLSAILKHRSDQLQPIIHMCDALKSNLTPAFKTIILHCLSHGRRKFIDVEAFFPEECAYVIEKLGQVYWHDAQTKQEKLSAQERLHYHQEHSAPIMKELKTWLHKQLDENLAEPNGGLGKAIKYLINHWEGLTMFLQVAGGPIDNNIVERALKIPIRLRKNSLIHRTCHGASVASILMSIIQTCRLNGVNPVDYLVACQENRSQIFKQPRLWLPWNYQDCVRQAQAA